MLKIKVYWHNLSKCLSYWREAINKGVIFKIDDIKNSFYSSGFYSRIMFFNNQEHFNKFCINHNIKDYEYMGAD